MIYTFEMDDNDVVSIVRSDCNNSCETVLTNEEHLATTLVIDILKPNGVVLSKLSFDRTEEYLKLCYGKYKLVFCRFKLCGRALYMELTISAKQAKRLKEDPRFLTVKLAQKRFTRIPIMCVSDIPLYSDVILGAFQWGTINCDME